MGVFPFPKSAAGQPLEGALMGRRVSHVTPVSAASWGRALVWLLWELNEPPSEKATWKL